MSILRNLTNKITMVTAIAAITGLSYTQNSNASVEMMGLNLSAAGFGTTVLPGKLNTNYTYPTENYFQNWSSKGVKLIRFPITWERMQTSLNADLDRDQVKLLLQTLNYAKKYNMQIIIDVHNYGRYYGKIIGKDIPYTGYSTFIQKLVMEFNHHPSILGWDIMNEPYGMPTGNWPKAAQLGIDAVRSYDQKRPIFIEGEAYSTASRWKIFSDGLKNLKDPYNNLVFSAHIYFDSNESGVYAPQDMSKVHANLGIEKVKPFVDWLKENNLRGYIGEMGIPDDNPIWNVVMDNTLKYLSDQCIPTTYWAAGPWWGSYKLAVEPINGKDRPQWPTIKKYVGKTCDDFGPVKSMNPSPIKPPVVQPPITTPNSGSNINNFTNNDWDRGIWRKSAGFTIPASVKNKSDFVKGATVKLADGQTRKITAVYVNGSNMSIYLEGSTLNPSSVGYPKNIEIVGNNNSVPTPNPNPIPSKPINDKIVATSVINNFTNNDWNRGMWRKSAGFTIPNNEINRTHFKKGNVVKFADGQVRKITASYSVGSNISVYLEGSALDAYKTGYPNKVQIINENVQETKPTPPNNSVIEVQSTINNFTNNDWNKGIYRKNPGFSIPTNITNKSIFKVGAKVKFANNEVRTVKQVYIVNNNMSVYVDGSSLDGNRVGYPNKVAVIK